MKTTIRIARILLTAGVFVGLLLSLFVLPFAVLSEAEQLPPLPTVTGELAGSLDGQFEVSQLGGPSYTMPLHVPPGTAGMSPKLTLSYGSGGGSGMLGAGWSLGGLSVVTRCATIYGQDGIIDGVDFDANDKFCLDGQRLMVMSGVYGGNGAEYRTQIDGQSRIISSGQSGSGPTTFTVYAKSGLIYEYGTTSDSRVQFASQPGILVWKLSRVRDRSGNAFVVRYTFDVNTGESLVSRIDYTENTEAGLGADSSVQFEYISRQNPLRQFLAGAMLTSSKLLSRISMHTAQGMAWNYQLSYQFDNVTRQDRFVSVRECSPSGECLPSTDFTWGHEPENTPAFHAGVTYANLSKAQGFNWYDTVPSGILTGDWNADGKTDVAAVSQTAADNSGWFGLHFCHSLGTTFGNCRYIPNIVRSRYPTEVRFLTGDWNGDGRSDVLAAESGSLTFYVSTATGLSALPNVTVAGVVNPVIVSGDWDGDARTDVALFSNGGTVIAYLYSRGTSFSAPQLLNVGTANGTLDSNVRPLVIGDWNGDGLSDFARVTTTGVAAYISTGSGFQAFNGIPNNLSPAQGYTNNNSYPIFTGDWNGDGLTDIGRINGNGIGTYYANGAGFVLGDGADGILSPGQGFANNQTYPIFVGDFNGDGISDIGRVANDQLIFVISNGRGFIYQGQPSLVDLAPQQGYANTTNFPLLVGDWNGDRFSDVARISATAAKIYTHITSNTTSLLAIRNGFGAETKLNYEFITNGAVYTKGAGAVYPMIDLQYPMQVVSSVAVSNGIGSYTTTTYKYEALIASLHGRGLGGFQKSIATNTQSGNKTLTTYAQIFPHIGRIKTQEVRLPNNVLVSSLENTWTMNYYPYPGDTFVPYVARSIEKTFELGGTLVTTVTTNNHIDDYGNPTGVVVQHMDGSSETSITTYNNDTANWLIGQLIQTQVTKTGANGAAVPAISKTSRFSYVPVKGLLQSETIEPGNDSLQLSKTYTYDAFGNIRQVATSGTGFTTRQEATTYDVRGQYPISRTNAVGQTETREYDLRFGKPAKVRDPNGLELRTEYDAFGRVSMIYQPDGTMSRTLYLKTAAGAPGDAVYYLRVDSTGQPPALSYHDRLSREIRKETVGFAGQKIYADKVYDELGRLTHVSEPYFAGSSPLWTVNEYDLLNRVKIINSPGNRQTSYTYNGLTSTVTNALGQKRTQVLDAQGRVVLSKDNLNNSLTTAYDSYGQPLRITDAAGNVTTAEYNILGYKTRLVDPDMGATQFTYDALGQLLTRSNALQQTSTYTYDKIGRLLQRQSADGAETYSYDTAQHGIGKLGAVVGIGGYREDYSYDALGRGSKTDISISGQVYGVERGYDALGRMTSLRYPGGFALDYDYNQYGYLSAISGRGQNIFPIWQAVSRNARAQLEQQTFGNGLSTSWTYDANTGLVKTIKTGTLQDQSFTFDAVGNLTQRKDLELGLEENFTYDSLNRLTSAQVAGQAALTLSYDSVGNILSKSDTGTYVYGTNGVRPHAVTAINGPRSNTYTYDAAGRRVASSNGSIEYNTQGYPVSIRQENSNVTFQYGPEDKRYEERKYQAGDLFERKVYVGQGYERIERGSYVMELHYIYSPDGPVATYTKDNQNSAGILKYLLVDHLGSIQTIVGENQQISERLSYDSWGVRRDPLTWAAAAVTPDSAIDRGFTGHEHLDEVGLIHMNGRVYDPYVGRFVSADPHVQAPEDMQSLNRYSYVRNNPLSFTDPSGFFFKGLFKAIGAIFQKVLPIAIQVAVFYYTGQIPGLNIAGPFSVGNMIFSGMTSLQASLASAAVTALVTGESPMKAMGAVFKDAPMNLLRGAAIYAAGTTIGPGGIFEDAYKSLEAEVTAFAHSVTGDLVSAAGQGVCASDALQEVVTRVCEGSACTAFQSSLSGGSAVAIAGGKFEDGAMRTGFGHVYGGNLKEIFTGENIRAGLAKIGETVGRYEALIDEYSQTSSFAGPLLTLAGMAPPLRVVKLIRVATAMSGTGELAGTLNWILKGEAGGLELGLLGANKILNEMVPPMHGMRILRAHIDMVTATLQFGVSSADKAAKMEKAQP